MKKEQQISIPSNVFAQMVDDEMVILDTQSENYFGLDAIGTVMWEQLVKNPSLDTLKEEMLAHYDVEEAVLENDIRIFIDSLIQSNLVTLG